MQPIVRIVEKIDKGYLNGTSATYECGHSVSVMKQPDANWAICHDCPAESDHWVNFDSSHNMEWICKDHYTGHPDNRLTVHGVHGCCGCCSRSDFPGRIKNYDNK